MRDILEQYVCSEGISPYQVREKLFNLPYSALPTPILNYAAQSCISGEALYEYIDVCLKQMNPSILDEFDILFAESDTSVTEELCKFIQELFITKYSELGPEVAKFAKQRDYRIRSIVFGLKVKDPIVVVQLHNITGDLNVTLTDFAFHAYERDVNESHAVQTHGLHTWLNCSCGYYTFNINIDNTPVFMDKNALRFESEMYELAKRLLRYRVTRIRVEKQDGLGIDTRNTYGKEAADCITYTRTFDLDDEMYVDHHSIHTNHLYDYASWKEVPYVVEGTRNMVSSEIAHKGLYHTVSLDKQW